jgi:hypothetical protein
MRLTVTLSGLFAGALLVGCNPSETKFIDQYVAAECDYRVTCYDPAILQFYGYADAEGCVASFGPEFVTQHQGCTYDAVAAKQCVKALEELSCPAEGEDPADPEICGQVFTMCAEDTDL